MKKLMTAIAAVTAAFGLYATELTTPTGTSFEAEAFVADQPFNWTKDDAGGSSATYWSSTDDEVGTIKAYADGEAYSGEWGRPAMFPDGNTKYLELDTSSPLTRWANSDKTTAYAIGDTGLYFDQLVKFTAPSDAETTIDLAGGKIALWLKETEDDIATTDVNEAATNLMITAGFFTGDDTIIKQNDYTADYDCEKLVGKWARVTIKAIKITDAYAGFVVYIDGTAVATLDSIGTKPALSQLGEKYAKLGELFPSAVIEGGYAQTISAVAFNGSGAIDDVSFTAVVPEFAKDEITFDLDWNKNDFASITAGGQELNVADGSTNLVLSGDTTSLKIVYTLADGRDCTVSLKAGDGAAIDPNDDMTFTFSGMASGSIVSKFNFFQVGSETYPTFADALAAVKTSGEKTITLKDTCPLSEADVGAEGIVVDADVKLDLAGNNLLVDSDTVMFDVKAAFTVVNSGDTNAKIGIDATTKTMNVFAINQGASLTFGTEDNEGYNFVVVEGAAADVTVGVSPTIYQGMFLKDPNTDTGAFAWADGVDPNKYDTKLEGGYWIVQEKQAQTTITVTIGAAAQNAKIESVLSNSVSVAYVAGDYVIPAGEKLVVTYAPNAGYEFGDVAHDVWMLDTDKAASECPTATAINYTIIYNDYGRWVDGFEPTSNYTIESETFALPDAKNIEERVGGTFKNWTNELGDVVSDVKQGSKGNLVLYAWWETSGTEVPVWVPEGSKEAYKTYAEYYKDIKSDLETDEDKLNAFLLNAAPTKAALDEAKKAFQITSITFEDGVWKVTTVDGSKYNGTIKVEAFNNPGCTGDPVVKPEGDETELFYRAKLVPKEPVKD